MAGSPDRDLGEARAAIDRGDTRAALTSLDRARKGYASAADNEGLEHGTDTIGVLRIFAGNRCDGEPSRRLWRENSFRFKFAQRLP